MVCRPQAARPISVGLPAVGDYAALLGEAPHLSTVRNSAGLWEPATKALSFREGLLDHELRGLAMIALDKAALREQHARVMDQRRAAADHYAVVRRIERSKSDIGKQFSRRDQVGNAAAVAEGVARHRRIIDELAAHELADKLIVGQSFGDHLAIG